MTAPDLAADLRAARTGDAAAEGRLLAELYPEMRRMARARLRQHQTFTLLGATALVHETWLRMFSAGLTDAADRAYLLGYAGRTMRSVIVDHARERLAAKRGAGQADVPLHDDDGAVLDLPDRLPREVVAVHEALVDLARSQPQLSELVELRYFVGLTEDEVATLTGRSLRTVQRDWMKARALLLELLQA